MTTGPQDLLALQNPDGGWSYRRGGSWTEPSCYALFALAAAGLSDLPAARRGFAWLQNCHRPDGGFAPRPSVPESTWTTALAILLPSGALTSGNRAGAGDWLAAQTGRESGWVFRLRLLLLGIASEDSRSFNGWPWYPGAAAWVAPTALSVLALEKLVRTRSDAGLEQRAAQGRAFLLARHCRDGGWNHGSTRALGYDSDSYPESTGIALLALHSRKGPEVGQGIIRAEQHLAACQSYEAAQWLRLGLLSHGRKPNAPALETHGTTLEIALAILADAAERGQNWFLTT